MIYDMRPTVFSNGHVAGPLPRHRVPDLIAAPPVQRKTALALLAARDGVDGASARRDFFRLVFQAHVEPPLVHRVILEHSFAVVDDPRVTRLVDSERDPARLRETPPAVGLVPLVDVEAGGMLVAA